MSKKKMYYIGLDQGTTGTTTLLLDEQWNVIARGYKEHKQYYPKPGWVEHDPLELWQRVLESISMALEKGGVSADQIKCIGIDNQGETVMLWDKVTGEPVYNAIVWQDRRMARYADELTKEHGEIIREKTGLMADSYFSGPKIKWIIDNVDGVKEKIQEGRILAGTLDTWLIWKMTHGRVHVTDCSTASRTMMLNIHTGKWDEEILDILGISKSILPEICDSSMMYGKTDPLGFSRGFDTYLRLCGRSAGGAVRAGLLQIRDHKVHVPDRMLHADEHRRQGCIFKERPSHHSGMEAQ